MSFTSWNSSWLSVTIRERLPGTFSRRKREGTKLKCTRAPCSFQQALLQKKLFHRHLTHWSITRASKPEERQYPTPATFSHPLQPEGKRSWETLVKYSVQGRGLPTELGPGHRTTGHFFSLCTLASQCQRTSYSHSFYPLHHVWISRKKNHKKYQKVKQHHLKRQSEH